ncbi:hypothetical protein J6590_023864 [Homalodisca vitripennis]|nr:hypothetical protein J6590_023864 [Homalodisca vitripennis]
MNEIRKALEKGYVILDMFGLCEYEVAKYETGGSVTTVPGAWAIARALVEPSVAGRRRRRDVIWRGGWIPHIFQGLCRLGFYLVSVRVKALVAFATCQWGEVSWCSRSRSRSHQSSIGRRSWGTSWARSSRMCSHGEDSAASSRLDIRPRPPDGGDVGRSPDYGIPHEPVRPRGPPETHALDCEQLSPGGPICEMPRGVEQGADAAEALPCLPQILLTWGVKVLDCRLPWYVVTIERQMSAVRLPRTSREVDGLTLVSVDFHSPLL